MNKIFLKVFILFLLIITNLPAPIVGDDNYQVMPLLPTISSEDMKKKLYSIVRITIKYSCDVEPNNLNSRDTLAFNHPIFLIEMPDFDVYKITELHFKDENLRLTQYGYYNNGYTYEILNTHTIKIVFYNNDIEKLKRFPQDLVINSNSMNEKFIVNNVIYDKNSFFRAEENLKECEKLIELKKAKKEQPANRLRNFFGADMK